MSDVVALLPLHLSPWNFEDAIKGVASSIQASFTYPVNHLHLANDQLSDTLFVEFY